MRFTVEDCGDNHINLSNSGYLKSFLYPSSPEPPQVRLEAEIDVELLQAVLQVSQQQGISLRQVVQQALHMFVTASETERAELASRRFIPRWEVLVKGDLTARPAEDG